MPPRKKKAKVGSGASPATPDAAVAASMSAVTPFQRDVSLTVELMYSLRHGVDDGARKRPLEDMMEVESSSGVPKPDSDGVYPFPRCSGGTFMEMAQRAQACDGAVETGWLAKESAEFCAAAGLLDSADPMEFLSEFVVAKVPQMIQMLNLWCCFFSSDLLYFHFHVMFLLSPFSFHILHVFSRHGHQSWDLTSLQASCAGLFSQNHSGVAAALECQRWSLMRRAWL